MSAQPISPPSDPQSDPSLDPITAYASQASPQQSDQAAIHLQKEIELLEKKREAEKQAHTTLMQQQSALKIPSNFGIPISDDVVFPSENGQGQQGLISPRQKERRGDYMSSGSPESAPIKEIQVNFEAPPDVEQWVKPKPDPQTITLPQPVQDEYGEILLQASQIPKPKIILPMSEQQLKKALHHHVRDSVKWLAEWCLRTIRLYPGRVFYHKAADSKISS